MLLEGENMGFKEEFKGRKMSELPPHWQTNMEPCWGKRAEGAKWLKWERLEAGGLRNKKGDKTMYLREMLSRT